MLWHRCAAHAHPGPRGPGAGLLASVRERGYIVCDGFISEGATGIAVPVRDGTGETVAALSVVVPSGGTQPMAYVNALTVTARAIGRELAKPRLPQWHPMQPTSSRGARANGSARSANGRGGPGGSTGAAGGAT